MLSTRLAALKRWPSDEEVVPSLQCAAKGWRNCALTNSANAAEHVSSRMYHACNHESLACVVPEHDARHLAQAEADRIRRAAVSNSEAYYRARPDYRGGKPFGKAFLPGWLNRVNLTRQAINAAARNLGLA